MSQNKLNSEVLWDRCKNHDETITFVATDLDTVIGFYCPDKLRDTTHFKDSTGNPGWIDVKGGSPFMFYLQGADIRIIQYRS